MQSRPNPILELRAAQAPPHAAAGYQIGGYFCARDRGARYLKGKNPSMEPKLQLDTYLPSTAILIPTARRPEKLKRCLEQLIPYVSEHPECMIVVSDDGDATQTLAALGPEFSSVRVVQGPRRGPASNRNCAAANSTGDLLIFLDDDCTPEPNLVAAYQRAALANPDAGVFEGRTTAVGQVTSFAESAPANETGGFLWSCNFAIRREIFVSVGGFDERFVFPAMEDVDMHFRVKARTRIQFVPNARVFHDVERRVGWKGQRHYALSLILHAHLRGLKETEKDPVHWAWGLAHLIANYSRRLLRREGSRDPLQAVMIVWSNSLIFFVTILWKFRAPMARFFFPPCCDGCKSIHATLNNIS